MLVFFTLIFIMIMGLWFYAIRPKKTALPEEKTAKLVKHCIYGGGILFPSIGLFLVLVFGIPLGYRMLPLPLLAEKPLTIHVTGHQWWWEIEYPDYQVRMVNELHLPANQPIDIYARSADVIHSFWIPRLNGKIDMIPGHTNLLRLMVSHPGHYQGQCAEFCGLWHAKMRLPVTAHSKNEFLSFIKKAKTSSSQSFNKGKEIVDE